MTVKAHRITRLYNLKSTCNLVQVVEKKTWITVSKLAYCETCYGIRCTWNYCIIWNHYLSKQIFIFYFKYLNICGLIDTWRRCTLVAYFKYAVTKCGMDYAYNYKFYSYFVRNAMGNHTWLGQIVNYSFTLKSRISAISMPDGDTLMWCGE